MERRKRTDVISRSLAAVRLSGYEKRRVDTLSGGERQRVAIARALAASPRALLMDEPFSSLDAPLRRSLRAEFKELRSRERFPCIFVTHDREEAAAVGDRIAVMHEGRIIECGTPTRLFNEPKTAFVARFLGSGSIVPILAVKRSAEGCSEVLTPFGGISLPFAVSMDQALVVPPDAVSLETANSDQKTSRMRVVSTGFEGDATEVLLETENHTPIRASLNRRIIPPKIGDMVGARIDWSLSRPVI
jgi:ABC-type Fe3+/spermidine/putrescine transport system ATPase subunit